MGIDLKGPKGCDWLSLVARLLALDIVGSVSFSQPGTEHFAGEITKSS
ncbi:MAG: hypothetical protein KGS72_17470 [Cyanobacteria bacterium REEB67]|nr:hypothetical protein [Cyanobacteria bacterium REEB67]